MNKTNKLTNVFENIKNSKYFELLPDFKNEKAQKFKHKFLQTKQRHHCTLCNRKMDDPL